MSESALNFQYDGTHYIKMKMQPLELAYLLGASPCFTKVAKYITRKKGTHLVDLNKALTCIEIEEELTNKGVGLWYFEAYLEEDYVFEQIDKFTDVLTYRMILKDMYFGEYEKAKNILKALILEQE